MKDEYILGVHIGHDRCVAILKNGELICALPQDRLDGKKYSQSAKLPFEAINKILDYTGITAKELSFIGVSYDVAEVDIYLDYLRESFYSKYGTVVPMVSVGHHISHAYSTACAFGKENTLVLVADGGGHVIGNKSEAESLFLFTKNSMALLERRMQDLVRHRMMNEFNHFYPFMSETIKNLQISIGRKYEQVTYLLGFKFGQAGKTMGLASYGKSLIDFSNKTFKDLSFNLTFADILSDIHYIKSISDYPTYASFIEGEKQNIAATVQSFTEHCILSLVNSFVEKYNMDTMCFAGGVFLNCLVNTMINEKSKLSKSFVFPAAGDDGQAVGNACFVYNLLHHEHASINSLPYIGIDYSNEKIKQVLNDKGLNYQFFEDTDKLIKVTANYILNDNIVGIHRGRTEIGPRALCHRSILANPANPNMKDIINDRVKHREAFRPFAPVVTEERSREIFSLTTKSPFMLLAPKVNEKYRHYIPSVVHVDNTARLQTISKKDDYFIHELLCEVEKTIGVPVLLNTSFNVNNQPIVETPEVAIDTFLRENIDILIIGNFVVSDKKIKTL